MAIKRIVRVRSIDAWRSPDGGWYWNDSHGCGELLLTEREIEALEKPRAVFVLLRREEYLTLQSAGRLQLYVAHGDPSYYEIQRRGTGEPVLALVVGWGDGPEDVRED